MSSRLLLRLNQSQRQSQFHKWILKLSEQSLQPKFHRNSKRRQNKPPKRQRRSAAKTLRRLYASYLAFTNLVSIK